MSELVKKRPCSNYTDAEIEEGLRVLALCSGNTRRAAQDLKRHGKPIPRSTLQNWQQGYPDAWERIQKKEVPKVFERVAEQTLDLALAQGEVVAMLTDQVRKDAKNMDGVQAATAAQKLNVGMGINVDKASAIHGRPTQITERRDASELVRVLAARFGGMITVDSTAVEVSDA